MSRETNLTPETLTGFKLGSIPFQRGALAIVFVHAGADKPVQDALDDIDDVLGDAVMTAEFCDPICGRIYLSKSGDFPRMGRRERRHQKLEEAIRQGADVIRRSMADLRIKLEGIVPGSGDLVDKALAQAAADLKSRTRDEDDEEDQP